MVPGLLSLGHTIRVVKEEAERKLSRVTGGASEIIKQQLIRFVDAKKTVLSVCAKAIESYFDQDEEKRGLFAASIAQVKNSTESTLQNEYRDSSYVPIGKTVMLAQGRATEMLDQGPKIKERIL